MRTYHLLGVLTALLFSSAALAADGDRYAAGSWSDGNGSVEAFYLCDGSHAAANACAQFDLRSLGSGQKRTPPSRIQFFVHRQSASCTPTVTIIARGQDTATGGATMVDHTIQALTGAGTSSVMVDPSPLFPVYYATVSLDADCSDLEVVVALYFDK